MKTKLTALMFSLYALNTCAGEALPSGVGLAAEAPLDTIAALDVPRYMGRWYEIAKFPNWFQKKCTSHSSAECRLKDDGEVQVINRCRLENGEMNEATGTARQIGASTSPKLQVRFAPVWLSLLPGVWGDYWIIELDEHYQLVAISDPKREYLWVLSRTPSIAPTAYAELLGKLQRKGFDVRQLELTRQD